MAIHIDREKKHKYSNNLRALNGTTPCSYMKHYAAEIVNFGNTLQEYHVQKEFSLNI